VIGLPFNDHACLGSITEVIAELIQVDDPVIAELAANHPTTKSLVGWIRTLPQRDDIGAKNDGPKVEACDPPQRLRLPADDPNCVERAAMYLAIAELIDPWPIRQLATLDTPLGLHTFPVENGAPVILDPRVPRNCLHCGVMLAAGGPVELDARDVIDYSAQLAETSVRNRRNGPGLRRKVKHARNAVMRLVDDGRPLADRGEADAVAWMFALAEQAARKMGLRVLALVKMTAQAVVNLANEALARSQRNMPWLLAALEYMPPEWKSQLGKIAGVAGNVGLDIGSALVHQKLASYGVGEDIFNLVEQEANREGMSFGALTKPPKLPTFASLGANRAA
jgi:hypothetical protein